MEKKKNPFGTIDANENARQEVQDIINATAHAEQPAEEKKPAYSSYDDIYKMLSEQKAANDAQAADADRRARLAKTQEAIGGIYDLGRAISNLYGTTQYAPNVNMESMSDKARARYEKAIAEREGYKDAAMNYLLQGANIKARQEAAQQAQENFERQQKRMEEDLQRKKDNDEFNKQVKIWNHEYQQGRLNIQEVNAAIRKMLAQNKISSSDIRYHLASFEERTEDIIDPVTHQKIGTVKKRIVTNPDGTVKEDVTTQATTNSKNNNGAKSIGTPSMLQKNNGNQPSMLQKR